MNIIICVDDNNGIFFNHRRQSQDVKVRDYILQISNGATLWMSPYSAKQFEKSAVFNIADDCLSETCQGEFCFVEGRSLLPYEKWIEKIILVKWNRSYPSDMKFDIPLAEHGWKCVSTDKFTGNSHETISVEVYTK